MKMFHFLQFTLPYLGCFPISSCIFQVILHPEQFSAPLRRPKVRWKAMRPIPHRNLRKMMPFFGIAQEDNHDAGQVKTSLPAIPSTKHHVMASNSPPYRRTSSTSQAKQIISLNPIPLKKHGCSRALIQLCSEVLFPVFMITAH